MSFMTRKPYPDIPEKRRHFQPWVIPVDIPQTTRLSLMKWVLIVGVMFINVAAFAALEVAPSSYDFGKTSAGSSSAGQTFTLANTNSDPISVGTIETLTAVKDALGNITTVRSQEFIINIPDPCSNTVLNSAGTCQVTVIFKPKSIGAKTATLSIPTRDPNIPPISIPLSGEGTDDPNIEASVKSYDFGEVEVGKTSPQQIIMIRNTGRKSLEIGTISLTGDKDNFVFQDYCSNTRIISSMYCTLRVTFKPLSTSLKKATISIPSNDPDTLLLEITLTGGSDVLKVPNIEVTPLTEDFGEIQVGSASVYKNITISNTGTAYLQLGTVSLSGEDFTSMGDLCSNQKVRPGGSCYMNIRFEPKSLGAKTGKLTISSDDADMPIVTVELTGMTLFPNIEVEPLSQEFGDIPIGGTSLYKNVIFSNTGKGDLQLGSIQISGEDFIAMSDNCSNTKVTPSGYCAMSIRFEPKSIGNKTANLAVPSNDPDTPLVKVSLTGNGVTPVRRIEVGALSYDFSKINIGGGSSYQNIVISNTGNMSLQLGKISLLGDEFVSSGDYCSDKKIAPAGQCIMSIRFVPKALNERIGALSIPSDDSETPKVDIKLIGTGIGWCSGNYNQGVSANPYSPYFGVEPIGHSVNLSLKIDSWAVGCGALKIEDFKITGQNASEFSVKNQSCYYGRDQYYYPDKFYASCLLTLSFSPSSEGDKSAELEVKANGSTVQNIKLQAKAINPPAQYSIELSSTSLDFGNTVVGSYNRNGITLTNTSNANLHPNNISLSGNTSDFSISDSCFSQNPSVLFPSSSCSISMNFIPLTVGKKQAEATINNSSAPEVKAKVTLIGTGFPICAEETITIESIATGNWIDSNIWKRLQNFNPGEDLIPNLPRYNDVVRINAAHKITATPELRLGTLCVEEKGQLESPNNRGTWLYIYANDYIRNKGIIQGQSGAHQGIISAEPGAGLSLWVYGSNSWSPVLWNEGSILAGYGGDGKNTGADGGYINLQGNRVNVVNTGNGTIDAGRGGNITGINAGQGGKGGNITIRSSNLKSAGKGIHGGNGGSCNPAATEPQNGGYGGDLWLNGGSNVDIISGTHTTGKGGTGCEPLGKNGKDGGLNLDPSILTLAGVNTRIEGNDVAIFGGKDWILNLTNLSGTIVTANGDITLAVGEGSTIDFRGSTGKLFKANGQVYIFADTILLDENVTLFDLIDATNIVVGPNKILYKVSLAGPGKLYGYAGETLSVKFILSNAGPETDTYFLSATDSAGWNLTSLQPTIEVKGLETVELTVDVNLPALLDGTDVITVTAISQSDPEVIATTSVEVTVVKIDESSQNGSQGNQSNLSGIKPPPQPLPACVVNGIIDWVCRNNRDQILTNVIIETKGNVAGGILAGEVTNKGIISQVKVQSGAVVDGGKFTGYINNEGTLSNFEFVGAEIRGGTLAGTVNNNSQVGGTFKDVDLAANAHIIGGYLQGNVKGDKDAPALLENVTIRSDSLLSGVKLGEGVMLEAKVTCGEGVQAQEGVCPSEIELPPLRATTTNAQGEPMMTAAIFSGGISVNQGDFESPAILTITDLVDILGQIQVDPLDLGQEAEAVVYVSYKPLAAKFSDPPVYFMLNEKGDILPWNEDVKNLVAFQAVNQLAPYLEVPMYQGPLPATGHLKISFGYRLTNEGTVVHNLEPIEVTITE